MDYGKKAGDFSDGNGFYLTSNFQFAKAWSTNMMKKETSAVIVFSVDDPKDTVNEYEGLEYLSGEQGWVDIVTYYRNSSPFNGSNRKRREMESHRKYIYGPISNDGCNARNKHWRPSVRDSSRFGGKKGVPMMQLCIKDDFLADDLFDFSKISVIFFV